MIRIVKAGKHRFRPGSFGLTGRRLIVKKVAFGLSCAYNLHNENQLDVNKLFGVGFFLHHHRNSARFGWRWSEGRQRVEIFAYVYRNGERVTSYICDVPLQQEIQFALGIFPEGYHFQVVGYGSRAISAKPGRIGYVLGTYFGGNEPAPHDMMITIH